VELSLPNIIYVLTCWNLASTVPTVFVSTVRRRRATLALKCTLYYGRNDDANNNNNNNILICIAPVCAKKTSVTLCGLYSREAPATSIQ